MVHLDTQPYWIRTAALETFPRLDRNITVDAAIVGGGIVGITAAYLLKMSGLTVALLERARCAAIDTGHTTAHLTMVTDTLLTDLASNFGRDTATAVWDAGSIAIDRIESHVAIEDIDCGFRRLPGFLHLAAGASRVSADDLRAQADLAGSLGFAASYVDRVPGTNTPGVRFEDQAVFHPRKYLAGLLAAIDGDGSYVFEESAADEVTADPLSVKSGSHAVTCGYVVLATHTPLMGKTNLASATLLQSKLALYTSYAIAGRVPSDSIPHGLYWDTAEPYNYLRVEPGDRGDVIVFGGADHKTGQVTETKACFDALESVLRRRLANVDITDRWSGQVIETNDGLPYIGETAKDQFAATGFAGNGMTFGTVAAMMARDAVLGRRNPWAELFAPRRTKVRGGTWDYVRENKDYLYYLARDYVARHEKSLRTVARNEGRVVDVQGTRIAAFRDARGLLTLRSAVCTHMACEVHWNTAERTWDCPCHGSRFRPDGAVISGPAESPLPEATVDD
jgi:glycine/D-amino acid oxidase-like deaminating enzyme/nitrite reductase/ring-hydroxylating ferredoxin subunit